MNRIKYNKTDEFSLKNTIWNQWYRQAPPWEIIDSWGEEEKLYILPGPIGTVLDIGSGQGEYLKGWIKKHIPSVGLDISSKAIQQAVATTDPEFQHICRWYTLDWETEEVLSRGWKKKFDLVYSAMGPDMEKENSFQKMLSVSKKYCRLVVFQEGKNTVVTKVKKHFQKYDVQDVLIMQEPDLVWKRLLKKIAAYGYDAQIEQLAYRIQWRQDIVAWQKYLSNVYYPHLPEIEVKNALKEVFGSRKKLTSETRACYVMLTWSVQ